MLIGGQRFSEQLALVEVAFRVYARFVVGKRLQLCIGEVSHFGDANAMLARNHAIKGPRQGHDAVHRFMRGLQHGVIIAVDWKVGVNIAVTRVHVQSGPNTAFQNPLMGRVKRLTQRGKSHAIEQTVQRLAQLGFPTCAQNVTL